MDAHPLLEALHWRYAVKQFDGERTIPAEIWSALEETLVLSPSSYGLQPWKFLVITDGALRAELRPHSWNQSQITDCSHLVVFLRQRKVSEGDLQRLLACTAEVRGAAVESLTPYGELMRKDLVDGPRSQRIDTWASNQVYIALGNLLTSAALLGIDTCPIEGFSPPDYDRILDLGDTPYQSAVVCACGYRSPSDRYASLGKVRYPAHEVIEHR
ncbi:MAG: NAD(P)H-dependent oxidoreductase [Cyanobacteriota bacterium]|nr:NAD(P)H-dependent oxidoreductase [Cyanobacteriota bacterium]